MREIARECTYVDNKKVLYVSLIAARSFFSTLFARHLFTNSALFVLFGAERLHIRVAGVCARARQFAKQMHETAHTRGDWKRRS